MQCAHFMQLAHRRRHFDDETYLVHDVVFQQVLLAVVFVHARQRALIAIFHHDAKHRSHLIRLVGVLFFFLFVFVFAVSLHHIANKSVDFHEALRVDIGHHVHQNLDDFAHSHFICAEMVSLDDDSRLSQLQLFFLNHRFVHCRDRTVCDQLQALEIRHVALVKSRRLWQQFQIDILDNGVSQSGSNHSHIVEKHGCVADVGPQPLAINLRFTKMCQRLLVEAAALQPLDQFLVLHFL
mmetsp:Transcript_61071/g.97143  ORF Transcript_61071/g.97143 Transcript_61071/m.97143 type:complete len:238 (+) Transcript_61071:787-1500(+)